MCEFFANPVRLVDHRWDHVISDAFEAEDIYPLHKSLPEYEPTPLVSLPALAGKLGVGRLLVKDESHRFGLKAFKALGSTYAAYRLVRKVIFNRGGHCPDAGEFYSMSGAIRTGKYTFCTATDGNHGRGVAWAAKKLRQKAFIYMPSSTVPARIDNIRSLGAEVIIVDGNYDESVLVSIAEAEKNGWIIVSDTSWDGYEDIPRWIMGAYITMFREISEAYEGKFDVVFVQAGVGALAAAASYYFNKMVPQPGPKTVSVEPAGADCLLQSIKSPDHEPITAVGDEDSIMAGLNCGTPSPVAWPLIRDGFDAFLKLSDNYAEEAMRRYYYPYGDDQRIISGESGSAGLAAMIAIADHKSLKDARSVLGLNSDSTVLLLSTEGDTDPVSFERIVLAP